MLSETPEWMKGGKLSLIIESFSNAARTVQLRGFTLHNVISFNHTTNSDRTLATSTIAIPDIPIALTARASAAGVQRGALYVRVYLRIDADRLQLLFAGYVTDTSAPIYPNGKIESSIEGPGLIRSIAGTNPAAGTEISETVPTGAKWKLLGFIATFTTDATAGNRVTSLAADDGTTIYVRASSQFSHGASAANVYSWAPGITNPAAHNANPIQSPFPVGLQLPAGHRIRTVVNNLQAGDDWGAPQFLVEEWLEP